MRLRIYRLPLDIRIFDNTKAEKTQSIIFHNEKAPEMFDKKYAEKYNLLATIWDISSEQDILICKQKPLFSVLNLIYTSKKVKVLITGDEISIKNFKFNPKFNWGLVF